MKRLICFDVDGTLTLPRTDIEPKNAEVLKKLNSKYKLLIVSAGSTERIYNQLGRFNVDVLGNYGLEESKIIDGQFKIVRSDKVEIDKNAFIKTANELRKKYGYTVYEGESLIFHDSGLVTFSLLGSKASVADKLKFDPDKSKRLAMYDDVVNGFANSSVTASGTSSFDIAPRGYTKYSAIKRYADQNGYLSDEILFVGDEFDVCGGDGSVVGRYDYIEIDHYLNLENKLMHLY